MGDPYFFDPLFFDHGIFHGIGAMTKHKSPKIQDFLG